MSTSRNRRSRRRESMRPAEAGWRANLYDIIFEADTAAGRWFDIGLLVAILASITFVSLETVPRLAANEPLMTGFGIAEWVLTGMFTVEYGLRLACVRRPWRYAVSFWGIIDLLSILPSYLTLMVGQSSRSFVIIRSIRLLRVFRVLKLWRMMDEADELGLAIWRARNKIVVFLSVVLVAVTISGTLMYYIEAVDMNDAAASAGAGSQLTIEAVMTAGGDGNESPLTITAVMAENLDGSTAQSDHMFTSIPQAMYWAIVTMTTVGYGDIVPKSPAGKAISAMLILIGYSLIIVPSTFIGAEFVQQARATDDSPPCDECLALGHHGDAAYCYRCGTKFS